VIADWRGEYFGNRDLGGDPTLVRNDVTVDFGWGQGSPAPGLSPDDFSARWTRSLSFDGASYRFYVEVDDGARLWVDDELIIDAWTDGGARILTADRTLAGGTHRVRMEYYERAGDAVARLWWNVIESYPDWKAQYWSNPDLRGDPTLVRNDPKVDFGWGPGAPAPALPTDDFSARWTRTAPFDEGIYRFYAFVDDGVRLWVDDDLILDAWYDSTPHQVSADYALGKGDHRMRVEYYEHTGGAEVRVWWERIAAASYPDWKGEYWSNRSLSGSPRLARNDLYIDFDWGTGAPAEGLPADGFSVRWSRREDFVASVYRFRARSDDGIRVWVDDTLILDEWHDSPGSRSYSVDVPLHGNYQLVVEYYERDGQALVKFWWTRVRRGPQPD
jgi:hypothetical protein